MGASSPVSMTQTVSLVISGIAVVLSGGLAHLGVHTSALRRRLARADALARSLGDELQRAGGMNADLHRQIELARAEIERARSEEQRNASRFSHQQKEIGWLRAELERRPMITRRTYKVITIGAKWTGKTSLTLKWANPLTDLGTLEGTKIERYERTVSHVLADDTRTEHVFEVRDWGGEHIVDALHELIHDEIHGMLIVVDLGGKDARAVDHARIEEQLRALQPESLRFFFGPATLASCKTVVLFINKSDLLPGTPAESEAQAKELYKKLIDDLMRYADRVDIRILVGSASYGHSTHLLFSHFVERILPKNAYDNQLLQRLKTDGTPARPKEAARSLPLQPSARSLPPRVKA
jgi:hypothetical protein